ncbi:hypothetical protein DFH07DRAFT_704678, partial [Mycena maculata]
LLIQGTCAMPSPPRRAADSVPSMNVRQYTQTALQGYLSGINVANISAHFATEWEPVDFAGSNDGNISQAQINSILYSKCDQVPGIANDSDISFSLQYTNFIQQVNKALPDTVTDLTNNPQWKAAQQNASTACANLNKVLGQAVNDYLSAADLDAIPKGNIHDPGLLQWASIHYDPYIAANDLCMAAQNEFSRLQDTIMGLDGALFGNMREIITTFTASNPSYEPGINMPVTDGSGPSGSATQNYVAEYYVPLLNGTLQSWQENLLSNAPPSYFWNSSTSQTDNTNKTTSGSGGVSFIWDDVSGSGSGSGSTTTKNFTQSAESFYMAFGAITTVDIEYGAWFDNYRMAHAAYQPPKGDNVTVLAKPAFTEYFGTVSQPLDASRYNSQMIIGFRPTWEITFSDKQDYTELKTAAASAKGCFLFICAGGSGSSSSNHTTTEDSTMTIGFQDLSNNAYILGFIMTSFW